MYRKIMVPVDLSHTDRLEKALTVAADLAELYGSAVQYVGVTTSGPGSVAHTPEEYTSKLEAFGKTQAEKYSLPQETTATYVSHDPSVDLNRTLLRAVEESGADLVVVASHVPGLPEHIFASHAGYIAAHAKISVMVVR
ncbi:MAG TPA: universal stress protein [Aurantimonas sp.]